jgi:proline iminopeptidase
VAERLKASIRVVPGAGHFPWIDEPEAFAGALREALGVFLVSREG